MGRLRFELRTSRLKAGCSTAELATLARLGAPISAPMESITWSAINEETDGQRHPSHASAGPVAQSLDSAIRLGGGECCGDRRRFDGGWKQSWPTAVARGDMAAITIGAFSNVQDGAVLHGDPGQPGWIGQEVTIGHRAVIHGATLEDGCLVGIGAIVLNGVTIGAGALVAAGSVVTKDVPPRTMVMGIPAKVCRELSLECVEEQHAHARRYSDLAQLHAQRPE